MDDAIVWLILLAYAGLVLRLAPIAYVWRREMQREEMRDGKPGYGWEAPYRRPW